MVVDLASDQVHQGHEVRHWRKTGAGSLDCSLSLYSHQFRRKTDFEEKIRLREEGRRKAAREG